MLLMKKSDLNNQAIIMCGISGSGKTHYAQNLEKKGYTRLSSDAIIWKEVGENLFSLPKEEKKRLFLNCRNQVCNKLHELLKSGEKVVVDATHCRRTARDEIRRICQETGVSPIFIYCEASKEQLWQRLSRRSGKGPDDLLVSQEEFSDYWHGFEPPQHDETDFIFVNTE